MTKSARAWGAASALVTLIACANQSGEKPEYVACETNSQCVVVPESCCGTCGAPTVGDATAIATDDVSEFSSEACEAEPGCAACAPVFVDPQLVATCHAGRCEFIDLRKHSTTACKGDADCKPRSPDCCECGGDTDVGRVLGIAAAHERDYAALVCDPLKACDQCAPIYPKQISVACSAAGHCVAHDARLP